jgi:hypothetical protein
MAGTVLSGDEPAETEIVEVKISRNRPLILGLLSSEIPIIPECRDCAMNLTSS